MKGFARISRLLLSVIALLLVAVTLLPIVQSNAWWIRVWDFPRVQIFAISLAVLAAMAWATPRLRHWSSAVFVVLLAAVLFQGVRIAPYTALWPVDVVSTDDPSGDRCASVMVANVFMENRRSELVERRIDEEQPDIVLLLETDAWWSKQLDDTRARYAHVIDEPLDNTYGLLFMTRLESEGIELRHLNSREIPSIRASLRLRSGEPFVFYGLHPKPPRVGQDTDQRDNELTQVAHEVRERNTSTIVGGDLNDVAWSHTTRLFKRISKMLDPRRGRGLYASYHADYPLLRWPLDHLFATPDFEIDRLAVLAPVGSDHFPVLARFCMSPDARGENAEPDDMEGDDQEEMEETLRNE